MSPPRDPWNDVPATRRAIMQANRRKDTGPERALRSALHRRGLRYRIDLPIRIGKGRALRPDVVFPRARVAVYVDGCFWHGCPEHGTTPATRNDYWAPKIEENRRRDTRQTKSLEEGGWTVIRIWEHEDPEVAAQAIAELIHARAIAEPDAAGH